MTGRTRAQNGPRRTRQSTPLAAGRHSPRRCALLAAAALCLGGSLPVAAAPAAEATLREAFDGLESPTISGQIDPPAVLAVGRAEIRPQPGSPAPPVGGRSAGRLPPGRPLIGILNQLTGEDWQPFFERHIYGTEAPSVD